MKIQSLLFSLLSLAFIPTAFSAAVSITLPGTTEVDEWTDFTTVVHAASAPTTGDATGEGLTIVYSGSARPVEQIFADSLIYIGGKTAAVTVTGETTFNIGTVILQLDLSGGSPQALSSQPSLEIGGQTYTAGLTDQLDLPPVNGNASTLYLFQWDLSTVADATSYSISWGHNPHTAIGGIHLTAGDTFVAALPVPEPTAALLALGAFGALGFRRRKA